MRLFQTRRPQPAPVVRRVTPARPPLAALIDRHADDLVARSELEGRLARTVQRLERLAAELEARHQRYVWTEQLAAELRAIARDTAASERS